MTTVENALAIVHALLPKQKIMTQNVNEKLCGWTIAEDVLAPLSLPPFPQSSMDGYAVRCHKSASYHVVGEVQAGSKDDYSLQPGEAVRIFTGAKVPNTAEAVVIQENVERVGDMIKCLTPISRHQNIRKEGSQLSKGAQVFSKGHTLNPAALGLLQSLGITAIKVFAKPSVAIVITGNELIQPGQSLRAGQVYESNSLILTAALQQIGIEAPKVYYAKDTRQATDEAIVRALAHDVVLISGGISVGDYDFVGDSLQELGVETLFYKVRQKPGKPLFFGKKDSTYVFGLPGNPASTLNCFYVYVVPLLQAFMGRSAPGLPIRQLTLQHSYGNKFGRALFLKANATSTQVAIIDELNSANLQSFTAANALVYIAAETKQLEKGDRVKTWILPAL